MVEGFHGYSQVRRRRREHDKKIVEALLQAAGIPYTHRTDKHASTGKVPYTRSTDQHASTGNALPQSAASDGDHYRAYDRDHDRDGESDAVSVAAQLGHAVTSDMEDRHG
jgi:hypothetical protein